MSAAELPPRDALLRMTNAFEVSQVDQVRRVHGTVGATGGTGRRVGGPGLT